jgi:Bacterial SH3 domain
MQQSSHLIAGLPACLLAAVSLAILPDQPAEAQNQYRVTRRENFRREPRPDGRLLASVNEGAELMGGETRSGWVEVALEGWIWRQSLRPMDSTQYDYEVSAGSGENLRVRPNGPILARLSTGFWLQEVETSGEWVRVKRVGWMWARSLERAAAGPEPAREPTVGERGGSTSARPETETSRPTIDRAVTLGRSAMRAVPSGDTTAVLAGGAPLTILARSGPWVRVRAEGWVHESNLRPVSTDVLVGVSGAEVRAQPQRFEGRVLQWTVQLLAVRTSDGLRQEIPTGQRYILARGPLPEAGFVYVLLNDEHGEEIERLAPLAQLVVLVRVKVGRDRYLGNPVVELIEMSVRKR